MDPKHFIFQTYAFLIISAYLFGNSCCSRIAQIDVGKPDAKFSINAPSSDWESLIFRIANGVGTFGKECRKHSHWYCLDSYRTLRPDEGGSNKSALISSGTGLDREACVAWFRILIRQNWIKINMINFWNYKDCCRGQAEEYLVNGFLNKQMAPDDYMAKLTDYKNEDNKPLNYLSAFYLEEYCLNLIMDVGFGPGNLRRDHHSEVVEGQPYVIAGSDIGGDIGIQHILSFVFPFDDPGNMLTFHWFKHNIMCRDNAWICNEKKKHSKKGLKKDSSKNGSDGSLGDSSGSSSGASGSGTSNGGSKSTTKGAKSGGSNKAGRKKRNGFSRR